GVNVALPGIEADLDASLAAMQWVVNAYTLCMSALLLVGGAAADRFGRRRLFVLGLSLFALASLACGLAPSAAVLVAARAAQGAGPAPPGAGRLGPLGRGLCRHPQAS